MGSVTVLQARDILLILAILVVIYLILRPDTHEENMNLYKMCLVVGAFILWLLMTGRWVF